MYRKTSRVQKNLNLPDGRLGAAKRKGFLFPSTLVLGNTFYKHHAKLFQTSTKFFLLHGGRIYKIFIFKIYFVKTVGNYLSDPNYFTELGEASLCKRREVGEVFFIILHNMRNLF